jgi:hypothetical protein
MLRNVDRFVAVLLFATACAGSLAIEPHVVGHERRSVHVNSSPACPEKRISVIKAGEGKDVDAAAIQVIQTLRDAGYTVVSEDRAGSIDKWFGTSVVGTSESCGTSICAKEITGVLRRGGFRPALNPIPSESKTGDEIACAYSVYVYNSPKLDGQFILY